MIILDVYERTSPRLATYRLSVPAFDIAGARRRYPRVLYWAAGLLPATYDDLRIMQRKLSGYRHGDHIPAPEPLTQPLRAFPEFRTPPRRKAKA